MAVVPSANGCLGGEKRRASSCRAAKDTLIPQACRDYVEMSSRVWCLWQPPSESLRSQVGDDESTERQGSRHLVRCAVWATVLSSKPFSDERVIRYGGVV